MHLRLCLIKIRRLLVAFLSTLRCLVQFCASPRNKVTLGQVALSNIPPLLHAHPSICYRKHIFLVLHSVVKQHPVPFIITPFCSDFPTTISPSQPSMSLVLSSPFHQPSNIQHRPQIMNTLSQPENSRLLGCDPVSLSEWFPTFRRIVSHSPARASSPFFF
jgi:hypothetical protein